MKRKGGANLLVCALLFLFPFQIRSRVDRHVLCRWHVHGRARKPKNRASGRSCEVLSKFRLDLEWCRSLLLWWLLVVLMLLWRRAEWLLLHIIHFKSVKNDRLLYVVA
ncbi:hypothetical protein BC940DRAFT_287217 [Gongronella butleri]|nr:hypothetical protein BC940DRAFT_287217 [Gongronella butleri]